MRIKKTGNPLIDLVNMYPITKARAFEISRVHRTTFERWWKGKTQIPAATLQLIRLEALSELPSGKFSGWRVAGEYLVDSGGSEYHHDDIRRLWFYKQIYTKYLDMLQVAENRRKFAIPGSSKARF